MALEKTNYLYRIRVVFKPDGTPDLVETVHRDAVVEDGNIIAQSDALVRTYDVSKLTPAVASLLTEIARVGAEMDADAAAQKKDA